MFTGVLTSSIWNKFRLYQRQKQHLIKNAEDGIKDPQSSICGELFHFFNSESLSNKSPEVVTALVDCGTVH